MLHEQLKFHYVLLICYFNYLSLYLIALFKKRSFLSKVVICMILETPVHGNE